MEKILTITIRNCKNNLWFGNFITIRITIELILLLISRSKLLKYVLVIT